MRILPAGRLGNGWLLVREPAALAAPIPARAGALWDERFILAGPATPDQIFGALGADAAEFKNSTTCLPFGHPAHHALPAQPGCGDITFPVAASVCASRPGHIPPILQLMAIYLC